MNIKPTAFCFLFTALCLVQSAPLVALAQETETAGDTFVKNFTPLSPNLPLIGRIAGDGGVIEFLQNLLVLSVAVAAVLAVIMVAIGGFRYMTTDSVFSMGNAREQIANAIIGLLIVLTAILILKTINPDMIKIRLFTPGSYSTNPAMLDTDMLWSPHNA